MVADWRGSALRSLVAHADPLSAYAYRWFGPFAERATIDRSFDWYWRHLRRLDARFDLVLSASDGLSQRLREGGLRGVVTNPMGVEPERFSPALRDPALRAQMLASCGLRDEALLLIGIGRHSSEKRWAMVAQAVAAAGVALPIGLVLVGDGLAQRRVISAVGGNPHIHLLAPIADRDALARLMASADALIHGCEAETFCFVAAEALASGLSLIAPDQGGAADLARQSGGLTYRSGDATSAAEAIRAFATSPRKRSAWRVRTTGDHFATLFALYEDRIARETRRTG